MGKWLSYDGSVGPVGAKAQPVHIGNEELCDAISAMHNADCDAYEAKIAELEAELKTESTWLAEYQKQRDEAAGRLARIAALVRPVPVADLVEAGTEAPALLAERQRKIRAILEEDR